jgi:hypothetical protein
MSLAFIRATQRICKYCKKEGHNKPNCPQAFQKCEEIMVGIELIQHCGRREEERLLDLFNSELLTDLCFLMNSRNMKELVRLFLRNRNISEAESRMRYKRDRVKVLMLIFWFNSPVYKQKIARQSNKIQVKTLESISDLSEFECPICVSCLPAKEKVETGCKHSVCKDCLIQCFEHQILNMDYSKPRCSMCRANICQLTLTNIEYLEEVESLADLM